LDVLVIEFRELFLEGEFLEFYTFVLGIKVDLEVLNFFLLAFETPLQLFDQLLLLVDYGLAL
jgi:hypothetical protein